MTTRHHGPDVQGPSGVPDLRLYLLDMWRENGPFDLAAEEQSLRTRLDGTRRGGWKPERLWAHAHLLTAELFYVSEDMVDVLEAVAKGLPEDVRPRDVPTRWPLDTSAGLVVFARPVVGTDAVVDAHAVPVDAILWGQTELGPEPALGRPGVDRCVSIASYGRVDFDSEAPAALEPEMVARVGEALAAEARDRWARETGILWAALGRSDWPLDAPLGEPLEEGEHEAYRRSCDEDRRLLTALLLVMDEEACGLATVDEHRPDKPTRRRSERKGHSARVNLVYLRRSRSDRDGGAGGDGARRRAHVVAAHPRWQACGPRWTERKLVVVKSHVRGDGPLLPPRETVRVVK